MSVEHLVKLERFIGQELTEETRGQIDEVWDGFVAEEGDTFPVEDHDATRLNIFVDDKRKITRFEVG